MDPMDEKKDVKKLPMSSTKQEMLDAYGALLKQLQEKQAGELKPEKKIEEKKAKEAVQVAESLTSESVAKEINNLKLDINKMLTQLSDSLDGEVHKFLTNQKAIAVKNVEGASNTNSLANLQQLLGEQIRKQTLEK